MSTNVTMIDEASYVCDSCGEEIMIPIDRSAGTTNREGGFSIYAMNPDGSNMRPLTALGSSSSPAFNSDGSRITFVSANDVFVMNSDGSQQEKLTNANSFVFYFSPFFCPDGTHISYVQQIDEIGDAPEQSSIFVMNADGSGAEALTSSGADTDPSYSPVGGKIVFISRRDGTAAIYTMNADDGSNQTRVTVDGDYSGPVFSRDGERIFASKFVSVDGVNARVIVAMDAEGTNEVQLTSGSSDQCPSVSPPFRLPLDLPDGPGGGLIGGGVGPGGGSVGG